MEGPSWEANRPSRNCLHFTRPEGSLPHSQRPQFVRILRQINPVHASPYHFWRYIFVLSSHLWLGLPSGHLSSGLTTKTVYAPLLSPYGPHATPSHSSWFDHPNDMVGNAEHKAPRYVVFSSPLLPPQHHIREHLNLCSSLSVTDQASHPYQITGKITVLYILICMFWLADWKTRESAPNDSKLLLISSLMECWFVRVFSKYLKCSSL
jgi:hypothetical protein